MIFFQLGAENMCLFKESTTCAKPFFQSKHLNEHHNKHFVEIFEITQNCTETQILREINFGYTSKYCIHSEDDV